MSTISAQLKFGVKIELETPLVPSRKIMQDAFHRSQAVINAALLKTLRTTLQFFPGMKVTLTDAKTALEIDEINV